MRTLPIVFAFSVAQAGLAGARRMLQIIRATSDLDENRTGSIRAFAET